MTNRTYKLQVWNARKQPRIVAVEPWADEYTLAPEAKLTIVTVAEEGPAAAEGPWFSVIEWDDTTQVYCEATADYYVEQEGKRLL